MKARPHALTACLLFSVSCDDCDPTPPLGGDENSVERCIPADSGVLEGMTFHPQEADNWCWAASAQMLMSYEDAGVDVSQCRQAAYRFGASAGCECNGCAEGGVQTIGGCNDGAEPSFGYFGFDASVTAPGEPLSEDEIREQLSPAPCSHRPIAYSYSLDRDLRERSHMRVIFGFYEISGELWMDYVDPLGDMGPCSELEPDQVSYSDFSTRTEHYEHGRDYYNVRYAP